jgi:hypothetical protein
MIAIRQADIAKLSTTLLPRCARHVSQPASRRGQRHWNALCWLWVIQICRPVRKPSCDYPQLPPPNPKAETKNFSEDGSWPAGATPAAPAGFTVQRFADKLVHPRWIYVLPNGDILVAEASTKPRPAKDAQEKEHEQLLKQAGNIGTSADRITLLRDSNKDGVVDTRTCSTQASINPSACSYSRISSTWQTNYFEFLPTGPRRVEACLDRARTLKMGPLKWPPKVPEKRRGAWMLSRSLPYRKLGPGTQTYQLVAVQLTGVHTNGQTYIAA